MDRPPSSGRRKGPSFGRQSDRKPRAPRPQLKPLPKPLPKPLDAARLEEFALAYVARFATSAGKLRDYLRRKLRERGWEAAPDEDPQIANMRGAACAEALIERFVAAGYVDDESFARGRAGSLLRRGFGRRRINEALGAAGIDGDVREAVMPGEGAQRRAAVALARKRRFGPFGDSALAPGTGDPARRQKQIAAMLRAGHSRDAARAVLGAASAREAENWAAEEQDDESDGGGW